MKKNLFVFSLLLLTAMFVSGCGGKSENKMICSANNRDVVKYTYIFDYNSDGDKINSLSVEEEVNFKDVEDITSLGCGDTLEECMKTAKNDLDECNNNFYFVDCKLEKETKDSLKIVAKIADKELEKEENDLFAVNKNTPKDKAKEILEKTGYKCE